MAVGVGHRGHPSSDASPIAQPPRRRADVRGLAADHGDRHRVVAEAVGDLVDRRVEHQQVGALADLDRAAVVLEARASRRRSASRPRASRDADSRTAGPPRPITSGIENDRRGPRVGVGRQHDDRARVEQRPRPGRACSAPRNSAAGSSTAAQSRGGQRRDVVGVHVRQVVDRAGARRQRHRHRAMPSNCSTWTRSARPAAAASAPIRVRCSLENAIDSTKMSSALTPPPLEHLRHHRLDLVHPANRRCSRPGRRAPAARSTRVVCADRAASSRASASARSSPSRESP